jgi:hypothetical protein
VHEQHREIGLAMIGLDQDRTVHPVVAARLQHQAAPQVIEPLLRFPSLVQQGVAVEARPTVDDDPRRLAAGMHLDGGKDHAGLPKVSGSATPIRSFIISIEPSV